MEELLVIGYWLLVIGYQEYAPHRLLICVSSFVSCVLSTFRI